MQYPQRLISLTLGSEQHDPTGGAMFNIEGICDWCKQPNLLTPHLYVDGKKHHSCNKCDYLARLDVKEFNIAEIAAQQSRAALN
jgi:hypothetical protein